MWRTQWVAIFFSAATAVLAGQTMEVAVCNLNHLPDDIIERAKIETTYVFHSINVEIHWKDCDKNLFTQDGRILADFVVRLHSGGRITKIGPASLEAMGRAFMDSHGDGYMVDAYFGAIRQVTQQFPFVGGDQVLGYTLAHELGHMLVGVGHQPNGMMRAAWGRKELEDVNQRRLQFNNLERAAIIRKLQMRRSPENAPAVK